MVSFLEGNSENTLLPSVREADKYLPSFVDRCIHHWFYRHLKYLVHPHGTELGNCASLIFISSQNLTLKKFMTPFEGVQRNIWAHWYQ